MQKPNDFRTTPGESNQLSFFVFDNLRSQQDHEGGNVYRCDSIQEATTLFRYIQGEHPSWTIALGGSSGMREIDFIQRRGGVNCLITDSAHIDFWKDRPDVQRAIETAITRLQVEWQVDHELTGASILVPQEFDKPPLDGYLKDKVLRPKDPNSVLSSIQEIYAEGMGWLSPQELRRKAQFVGDEIPNFPKVTRLNAAYQVPAHQIGYVDVAPSDFRIMKKAYLEALQEMEQPAKVPHNLKTMDGWQTFAEKTNEHHLDAYIQRGDHIGQDMIDYFVNILLPATNQEHLVQIGSAYGAQIGEDGKLHPTFATFTKEDGVWRYAGHCFRGTSVETKEQEISIGDLTRQAKERVAEKNQHSTKSPSRPKDRGEIDL